MNITSIFRFFMDIFITFSDYSIFLSNKFHETKTVIYFSKMMHECCWQISASILLLIDLNLKRKNFNLKA
jgi:hypothetical protein